jgi:hypothetical protein
MIFLSNTLICSVLYTYVPLRRKKNITMQFLWQPEILAFFIVAHVSCARKFSISENLSLNFESAFLSQTKMYFWRLPTRRTISRALVYDLACDRRNSFQARYCGPGPPLSLGGPFVMCSRKGDCPDEYSDERSTVANILAPSFKRVHPST